MVRMRTNRTEGYFTAKGKYGKREPRVLLVTQGHGVKKKSMVFDELRTSCIEFFIFILTQQYNQHNK